MSRAEADLDQTRRDDIADLEAFEARFPPDAFEDIACALGVGTERPSLEELRELVWEDLYWFCLSPTADKDTRAKRKRQLEERAQAAATLLSSLRSGSLVDQPRVLLDGEFRDRFMGVLEGLSGPPRRRCRHRPKDRFRHELVPSLIWIYEHITDEKARKPHSLRGIRAYGGKFYRFACAVRRCLYNRAPEIRTALPATDDALAQELQDHWPKSDEATG